MNSQIESRPVLTEALACSVHPVFPKGQWQSSSTQLPFPNRPSLNRSKTISLSIETGGDHCQGKQGWYGEAETKPYPHLSRYAEGDRKTGRIRAVSIVTRKWRVYICSASITSAWRRLI